jgi:hypothetical protein
MRWLVRILFAMAIGWSLPAAASAQSPQPSPLPQPAATAPVEISGVVIHTNVPIPPPSSDVAPGSQAIPQPAAPDYFPEETRYSRRFHILPESWRDAISRRFGGGASFAPEQVVPSSWSGAEPTPSTPPAGVVPISSSAPPSQTTQLPQPEVVPLPKPDAPLPVAPVGPQPNETWASPPEPPITGQTPLAYRDPGMAWRKMPLSMPSDLPPGPAPPYPARFHLVPEHMRKTLRQCLNGCGLGCYADRDTPGCGSCRQEFLFVFGSCRYFFGERCFPDE